MKNIFIILLIFVALYKNGEAVYLRANVDPHINDTILTEVNQYRKEKGLKEVKKWNHLCNFASIRSKQITTDWSHDQFFTVMNTEPFNKYPRTYHENLAKGYAEEDVVDAWKTSKGHNEMMLSPVEYMCAVNNGVYYVLIGYDAY